MLAGVEPVAQIARLTQVLHDAGCDVDRVMPIFCAWLALPFARQDAGAVSPALQKQLLIEALGQWLSHLPGKPRCCWWWKTCTGRIRPRWTPLHHMAHARNQALALLMTCRPGAGEAESVQVLELARLCKTKPPPWCATSLSPRLLADSVVDSIVACTGRRAAVHSRALPRCATPAWWKPTGCGVSPGAQVRAIPITLRESLHSRFDQLGLARDILQLAATIGREVDGGLLRVRGGGGAGCAGAGAGYSGGRRLLAAPTTTAMCSVMR